MNLCCFPQSLHQFTFHLQCTRFPFRYILTLVISCLVDGSHFNRCEVMSHCGFDWHFPYAEWFWVSFHTPVGHPYVFLGKTVFGTGHFSVLWNFLVLLLSSLYEFFVFFSVSSLPDIWFAIIFPQWVFFVVFFLCISLLVGCSLTGFRVYFCFCSFCFWCQTQKTISQTLQAAYRLCSLLGILQFQIVTFKSLIHFELIFLCQV